MEAANYDNPWVRDAESARRRLPGWLAALIGGIFAAAVLLGAGRLAPMAGPWISGVLHGVPAPWPAIGADAALDLLIFGPFIVVALIATRIEGRAAWRVEAHPWIAIAVGLAVGVVGFGACAGVATLAGAVSAGAAPPLSSPLAGVFVGMALVAFQSAAEEVFFRGWLQPVLCARWGPWLGLIATAMLFAGLHILGGARSPLAMLNLFLGGLMFGLLALRSGGLWAAATAHFAWNWTESGGLGMDPNPGLPSTGALVDLDLHGSALWSGGADTMNGSLAASLVLVVIVATLTMLPASRSGPRAGRRSDPAP